MKAGKYAGLFAMLMAVGLSSCVKDPQDIPSGFSADPVFLLSGVFGGEALSIEAGKADWTMLPTVEVRDSLIVYSATFSKDGCLDQCSSSWMFRFYQTIETGAAPSALFNTSVQPGQKPFVLSATERTGYDISVATHPVLFDEGYTLWEDLNNATISYSFPFQTFIGYQQFLNVCLKSLTYSGCQYSQCIYFDPATQIPCLASIEPMMESARLVSLKVRPEGTPPFKINWFNGATTSSIIIPLRDSIADIFASVSVVDGLGNRSNLSQKLRIQNGIVDACYVPVSLESIARVNETHQVFSGRMELVYIDEEGQEWKSSAGVQEGAPMGEILRISPYEISPLQQPSYIVDLNVFVQLFNAQTGEAMTFSSDRLSIALSHP